MTGWNFAGPPGFWRKLTTAASNFHPTAEFNETNQIEQEDPNTAEGINATKVFDLKYPACPIPIVQVSKGIEEVQVGEVIEAHTTDPGSLADFPAWANTSGNKILKTDQEGDVISFDIERIQQKENVGSRLLRGKKVMAFPFLLDPPAGVAGSFSGRL